MVRTGKRSARLVSLLTAAGLKSDPFPRRGPRVEDLDELAAQRVLELYRALGGQLEHPVLRPGVWDLCFEDVVVELDEELHFNRYRATTLEPPWAQALPWTAAYRTYSTVHEHECLRAGRWGARWASPSSSRMFAAPAPPGDFTGGGSPRWKQRALYDAMRDAVAATGHETKVARLSMYDRVSGLSLDEVLRGRGTPDLDRLLALLSSRTT